MRIPGLKTSRQCGRWLRSRLRQRGLILGYHRIADEPSDPYDLCVAPLSFAEQLEVLRSCAYPMPLHDFVQRLQSGTLPERAVALTFDDGYADNLYTAKPLLERYQIPATVFVTTGYLGSTFWWDELASIVLTTETLPEQLCVTIHGQQHIWREAPPSRHFLKTSASRLQHDLLWWLYRLLEPLSVEVKQAVLGQVQTQCHPVLQKQPDRRPLRPDELLQLAQSDFFDVAAHTVTHSELLTLSAVDQRYEMEQSKATLEELLGRPIAGFSYPHGSLSDNIISMVQNCGFDWACSSRPDIAWRGSDPFQLPRFWVGNWYGRQFSQWLKRWL